MWGGARRPKFLGQFLAQISVFGAVVLNFSIPQLLSASVGFRGVPSPHIVQLRQRDMWEVAAESKVPRGMFSLNRSVQ